MPRPDPRQDPWHAPDPSFLGEQSQIGMGNAGPDLAIPRLLTWLLGRRGARSTRQAVEARARKARLKAERRAAKRSR